MSGNTRIGSGSNIPEYSSLEEKKSSLTGQKQVKKGEKAEVEQKVKDLSEQITQKRSVDQTERSKRDQIRTKINELSDAKRTLENKKSATIEKTEEISKRLTNLNRAKKNVGDIEKYYSTSDSITRRTKEIAALEKSIKNASKFFSRLRNRFSGTKVDIRKLKMALELKKTAHENIQTPTIAATPETLKGVYESEKEHISRLETELKNLGVHGIETVAIEAFKQSEASLHSSIAQYATEIDQLNAELSQSFGKTDALDHEIRELQQASQDAEKTIESFKRELGDIKKEIRSVEAVQKKQDADRAKISSVMPFVEKMEIKSPEGKKEHEIFRQKGVNLLKSVKTGSQKLYEMQREHIAQNFELTAQLDAKMIDQARAEGKKVGLFEDIPEVKEKTPEILELEKKIQEHQNSFPTTLNQTTDLEGTSPEIKTLKELYFALHPEATAVTLQDLHRVPDELRNVLVLRLAQLTPATS